VAGVAVLAVIRDFSGLGVNVNLTDLPGNRVSKRHRLTLRSCSWSHSSIFSGAKAERDSTNLRFLFGAGAATAIAARHAR